MIKALKENLDLVPKVNKKGQKKLEIGVKGIGLFDHIKHIRSIQDPNYFKKLTELDVKSFNHFMILKALSMNPALLEDISTLFRYFNKIPSPQLYQLLIGLIPLNKKYYPWIKSKKILHSKELLELISRYFEVSKKEAVEYATLLFSTDKGKEELKELCYDFGLNDKEVEILLKGNNDDY